MKTKIIQRLLAATVATLLLAGNPRAVCGSLGRAQTLNIY